MTRAPQSDRYSNLDRITALVLAHGQITRTQISELTGLTGAAVSRITRDMISAGVIKEGAAIVNAKRAGRREVMLHIADDYKYVCGITLTGNRRNVILATASGKVIEDVEVLDVSLSNPEAALQEFAQRVLGCLDKHRISREAVAGVGVSLSITATSSTDLITSSPLGWESVPVRDLLEGFLNLPVVIEARATSLLRADLLDNTPGQSAFLVNVALGVGSSAYMDQTLVAPGSVGFGGLTHLSIHGNATPCYCGRQGCLEMTGGGRAVLTALGHDDLSTKAQNDRLSSILEAAYAGDAASIAAIKQAATYMAQGVDHVLSLFAPEVVILTGIVGRHDVYRMSLIEELHRLGQRIDARRIRTSRIRSSNATVWLGLERFIAKGLVSTVQYLDRAA